MMPLGRVRARLISPLGHRVAPERAARAKAYVNCGSPFTPTCQIRQPCSTASLVRRDPNQFCKSLPVPWMRQAPTGTTTSPNPDSRIPILHGSSVSNRCWYSISSGLPGATTCNSILPIPNPGE